MEASEPKRRRKNLSDGEKDMVYFVYSGLKERHTDMIKNDLVTLCSDLTRVSARTVYNILKEKKDNHNESKNCDNNSELRRGRKAIELDEDTKYAIRRVFHGFFFKNEIPTIQKVKMALDSDESMPKISRGVLLRTLRHMNIRYQKRNRKSHLIEKQDIILWRRDYLKKVREFRREGKKLYYLDETWLNEGHTVNTVWQDNNITNRRQAFLDGFSTGLKAPSGKGRRLIITHIGSESGFVDGGLLAFE